MAWEEPIRRRDRPRRAPERYLDCCQEKVRYRDRDSAKAAAGRIRTTGVELRYYQCFNCRGWHLTRQEQRS